LRLFHDDFAFVPDHGPIPTGIRRNNHEKHQTHDQRSRLCRCGRHVARKRQLYWTQGSVANGVNADGTVIVGWSYGPNGTQGFKWTAGGGMSGLQDLPGGAIFSDVNAVSENGFVSCGVAASAAMPIEGALWSAGNIYGAGDFAGGAAKSELLGISGNGQMAVGYSTSATMTQCPAIYSNTLGLQQLTVPIGALNCTARDADATGETVVGQSQFGSYNRPTIWHPYSGTYEVLPDLPGWADSGNATAVSQNGKIVVGTSWDSSGQVAMIWDRVNGIQNLKTALAADGASGLTGWTLDYVSDVTVVGEQIKVCGRGINPNGDNEAFYAVLPVTHQIVTGQCVLDDCIAFDGQEVALQVRDHNTLEVLGHYAATLDAAGRYRVETELPIGDYDVLFNGDHWLRKLIPSVHIGAHGAGINVELINGDANGDNEVSIADYSILSSEFGTEVGDPNWAGLSDLDEDGSVDIADYAILSANFGLAGDE
jgi:probable HAF family extracellular repeat protein